MQGNRHHQLSRTLFVFISLLVAPAGVAVAGEQPTVVSPAPTRPKLILQITVDQLRGDMPERFLENMGQGGFRYLLDQGIWYANAHHGFANTETVVGHTTLATGADPSVHGMVGNAWLNRATGKEEYAVKDDRYPILVAPVAVDPVAEADKPQSKKPSNGRSPRAILTSSFGDELVLQTNGRAKVFSVSIKDRSAIAMAGHAGKAYWFSKKSLGFVTSTYYHDQYPEWISRWNDKQLAHPYGGTSWELMNPKATYLFGEADDRMWESNVPGWGRVFPHAYGEAEGGQFATFLTLSPATDELTLEFAKTLIDAEQLGADAVTDYLSIGFSATDYIGHLFGPSSLEAEDNMLRLDRTLSRLFAFVDQRIGLDNVLIVLSADHGAPEIPAYLGTLGIPSGYLMPNLWEKHQGIIDLKKRFGIGKKLITAYYHPYVYLNHALIAKKGLKLAEVEAAVAAELVKLDGVAFAITSKQLRDNTLPDTRVMRAVQANYQRDRSGDIFIVHQPHFFINDFDGVSAASVHGSPWRYDTHVPIVFVGNKLKPQKVFREIETVDVAPTLAAFVATKPPSGSRGNPLAEVLVGRK